MGLNYKEESVIDVTRAILVRVRKQEDDDNEGCFSTKPKTFKSALDVYLQLNFLVESESCSTSMMQPLLHFCILQGSPLVPAVLLKFSSSSATSSFYLTGYLPGTLVTEKEALRKMPKEWSITKTKRNSFSPSIPSSTAPDISILLTFRA